MVFVFYYSLAITVNAYKIKRKHFCIKYNATSITGRIIVAMVKFAKSYMPSSKIGLYPQLAVWLLVLILILMAAAQLVDMKSFVEALTKYQLPSRETSPQITAAILAICEVFALPFLLRMRLSYLMRWFSLLCGWIAVLLWACLSVWAFTHDLILSNAGLFGFVKLPSSVGTLALVVILVVLMVISSQVLRYDFKCKK